MDLMTALSMTTTFSRWAAFLLLLAGCASEPRYKDKAMDFASVKTVAVLPLQNLSRDNQAPDRVRSVLSNALLAAGTFYVLPQGEVAHGLGKAGVVLPSTPTREEVVSLGKALSVEAVVIGVLKEYGEIRAGSSSANAISLSVDIIETSTGKLVWSGSTTQGGIGMWDRLFGGGGEPMNKVTEDAVDDLLRKLFK